MLEMKLIFCLFYRYECIENDLLGSLQFTIHVIAPYLSKGIEKAEDLNLGWNTEANSNNNSQTAPDSNGEVA